MARCADIDDLIVDQITRGKQAEKKTEFRAELKKLEFSYATSVFVFSAPSFFWMTPAASDPEHLLIYSPPVPPPRHTV